jgi:acetylornithine deacetylase/succinyl-diaminopimelate desuccinylase-like protein
VYADWLHAGDEAPTVLIYGHFDVQPPDPLEEWQTAPFEPEIRQGYIFARGAADDKGQLYIHIKAVEAYLQTHGELPVNVKFILEGEEEIGGVNLHRYVQEHAEQLTADVALVSDTSIPAPEQPAIVYGLRGMCYLFVDIQGPAHDLHSGTYGGAIDNPLNVMAHVIAALKSGEGHVQIPGFYDDVRELSAEEREILNQYPQTEEGLLAETGAPAVWGEPEYTLTERMGARPTLDVHGIVGGYMGAGGKTVLPAKAHAKISMRLVPDQDPDQIEAAFRAYVQELVPETCTVTVTGGHNAPATIADYTIPAMQAARRAYGAVFEKEPVLIRGGGSIPVVGDFQSYLGLETVLMGFGLPGDRIHSPNERFLVRNFERGIETAIHFLTEYAALDGRDA